MNGSILLFFLQLSFGKHLRKKGMVVHELLALLQSFHSVVLPPDKLSIELIFQEFSWVNIF